MTDHDTITDPLRLHDVVEVSSKMFFDDTRPRQGRVVALDGDDVFVEFPDPQGRADYPNLTFRVPLAEQRHFTIVRRAADQPAGDRAEVARLRERLAEIGAYAAEQAAGRAGHSIAAGQAFQRIARLARS